MLATKDLTKSEINRIVSQSFLTTYEAELSKVRLIKYHARHYPVHCE